MICRDSKALTEGSEGSRGPGRRRAGGALTVHGRNSALELKEFGSRPVPSLEGTSNSMETPQRSRALLCENGKLIGTAHSQHADIRDKGAGLFSHWRNEVLFSSSDNSDPNTNGRTYSLVQPTR